MPARSATWRRSGCWSRPAPTCTPRTPRATRPWPTPGKPMLLFPTAEKYAVLVACGTNGDNYGLRPTDVINWLRETEQTDPFVVSECGYDFVGGRFLNPVSDPGRLAERMIAFCPDLIDGDLITSVESIARGLEEDPSFF